MAQLTLFDNLDNSFDGAEQHPISVAKKWGFPLQYHKIGNEYWYSVQDWLVGVAKTDNPRTFWAKIQKRAIEIHQIELFPSCLQLNYMATNNKSYQMDFAKDETLYAIVQIMGNDTGIKLDVLEHLRKVGALFNAMLENPAKASDSFAKLAMSKQDKEIEAYKKQGYDMDWIMIRMNGKIARKVLTQAIKDHVRNPRYDKFTNEEYLGLFERTAETIARQLNNPEPRDGMTKQANLLIDLTETTISDMLGDVAVIDMVQAINIIKIVCQRFKPFVHDVQVLTGRDIVTGQKLIKG